LTSHRIRKNSQAIEKLPVKPEQLSKQKNSPKKTEKLSQKSQKNSKKTFHWEEK